VTKFVGRFMDLKTPLIEVAAYLTGVSDEEIIERTMRIIESQDKPVKDKE
jgi:hypothetical protein